MQLDYFRGNPVVKSCLYIFLLLMVGAQSLWAQDKDANLNQAVAVPDVSIHRKKVEFNDPYPAIPEGAMPRKKVTTEADEPTVHIETSDAIDHVMELHQNRPRPQGNQGFRVQIYSGNNAGASNTRTLFVQRYDDVPAYTLFEQPIFKVRVGNFRTQKEADDYCKFIKPDFPAAFIVPDTIEAEEEPKKE